MSRRRLAAGRRLNGQRRLTPSQKLRSSQIKEFSGKKIKGMAIDNVFLGDDQSHSESDYLSESSDLVQSYNGILMPAGGQVWPSSIGIAGVQIGSGETVMVRAAELYENAISNPPDDFEGTLIIYDIQLMAPTGTSTMTAYTTTDRGGDGIDPGTGFQGGPFYFFCQVQSVNATAASAFSPSRAPPGLLPLPMGQYTDMVFVETGSNDMTATIYYAVMSYGGGVA